MTFRSHHLQHCIATTPNPIVNASVYTINMRTNCNTSVMVSFATAYNSRLSNFSSRCSYLLANNALPINKLHQHISSSTIQYTIEDVIRRWCNYNAHQSSSKSIVINTNITMYKVSISRYISKQLYFSFGFLFRAYCNHWQLIYMVYSGCLVIRFAKGYRKEKVSVC